jgi:hypothetical protein
LRPSDREPHWYRTHLSECVLCGRNENYRERVYGPKPTDPAVRYVYEPDHACEDHFL